MAKELKDCFACGAPATRRLGAETTTGYIKEWVCESCAAQIEMTAMARGIPVINLKGLNVKDPSFDELRVSWPTATSISEDKKEEISDEVFSRAREWLTTTVQAVREHTASAHTCGPHCIGMSALTSMLKLNVSQVGIALYVALRMLGMNEIPAPRGGSDVPGDSAVNNASTGPTPDQVEHERSESVV